MAKDLPQFDNLVQGDGYVPCEPGPDTLERGLGASTIPGLPDKTANVTPTPASPLTPMLAGFETRDAPPLGTFQESDFHDRNWLDPRTPHVSKNP